MDLRSVTRLVLALAAAAGCTASQRETASRPVGQATAATIDSLAAAFVAEGQVVGLQIALGIGDSVLWTGAYGMADLEQRRPMTDSTRIRTASISKWLTATAAMKLVEAGRLDLDAPVQAHCPEYPIKRWPLTTRQLLYHRGGVRHYWGANGEPRGTPAERAALEARIRAAELTTTIRYTNTVDPLVTFKDDPLLYQPGTGFRYTSFGYRLVGCVLRGAAGTSYNQLLAEAVLGPAAMRHTSDDDAYAIVPDRARGYIRRDGQLGRSKFRDVSENLPAGGHLSTASDLVRFALRWNAGALVSRESMATMVTPPTADSLPAFRGLGVVVARVEELGGRLVYLHSGSQDETRGWLVLRPDAGIAISTLSNDEDVPLMTEVIWPILRAVEGIDRSRGLALRPGGRAARVSGWRPSAPGRSRAPARSGPRGPDPGSR